MHRAGVERLRFRFPHRILLKSHSADRAITGLVGLDTRAHRAEILRLRRGDDRCIPLMGIGGWFTAAAVVFVIVFHEE